MTVNGGNDLTIAADCLSCSTKRSHIPREIIIFMRFLNNIDSELNLIERMATFGAMPAAAAAAQTAAALQTAAAARAAAASTRLIKESLRCCSSSSSTTSNACFR
jgi:ribosomal protein L12E/L44/L45/RPP1/RPP2